MRFILGALTGLVVLTTGAVAYAVLNPLPSARIAAQQALPAEPDAAPDAAAAMPDGAVATAQPDPASGSERPELAIASMADPVTRLSTADHPTELDQSAEMPGMADMADEMAEMADEATAVPEATDAIDMAALVAPVETPGNLPASEAPEIAPEIAGNTPALAEPPVSDETLMTDETEMSDGTVIVQPDPADGPLLETPEEIAGLEFADPDLAAPPMLRPTAWLAPVSEEAPLPPAADTLPPSGADLVYVTGNRVNMRSGPGSRHDWIATLSRGTGLVLIEKQGRWFKVQTDVDGEMVTGWMAAGYLSSQPVGT